MFSFPFRDKQCPGASEPEPVSTDGVKTVKALRQHYGDTLFFILIFTAAVSHPRRSLRFHCGSIQTILLNGLPAEYRITIPNISVFYTFQELSEMVEILLVWKNITSNIQIVYLQPDLSIQSFQNVLFSFYRLLFAETQ